MEDSDFEEEERQYVSFLLYKDITNMAEIKERLNNNKIRAAVLNPTYALNIDHLLAAAHKTYYNIEMESLRTKSIYTEFMYSLFPTKSIRDALNTLGVKEEDKNALFVMFNDFTGDVSKGIELLVQGVKLDFVDDLPSLHDVAAIRRLYKVFDTVPEESMMDCIVSKISMKDI